MVTNNKVLTVSYGTFSCTLEGFDESFETMKAIAEYFRDLAADDRYFGAEPPTPDAEMLARIAEREIERRVMARTEHGAIVLTTTPPQSVPKPGIDTGAEAASDVAAAPEAQQEQITDRQAAPEPASEPAMDATAQDITDAPAPHEVATTDLPEPDVAALDAEELLAPESTEIAGDDLAEDAGEDEGELAAVFDAEMDAEAEDLLEAPASPLIDRDVDSIAAKLQRIRAVVSKSRELPEEEGFTEDEHAEAFLSKTARDIETVLKLDDDMAVAARRQDEAPQDQHAPLEAAQAELDDTQEEHVEPEALSDHQDHRTDTVVPTRARVLRMKKADFDSAVDSGLVDVDFDDDIAEPAPETIPETAPEPAPEPAPASSLSADDEAELMAELAQVEAELNAHTDAPAPEAADQPAPVAATADVEAAPEDMAPQAAQDIADRPQRGRHLREAARQSDADMARLMEAAQSHLDEPDGSRRRQAIAHLRAAVAATKAEQKSGRAPGRARDVSEVYRDDLASVVSPVSTGARGPQSPRPVRSTGEPPLKLVAEQRVDAPAPNPAPAPAPTPVAPAAAPAPAAEAPRNPVRPRRVSAAERGERSAPKPADTQAAAGFASFAEFAESVGAVQLHDVLEAAASYLTFVEGRDVFSRPMIVRMARDMDDSDFSREDSLRGFGQLLRENKITKVAGGRFTASEDIGFRPEDRAVG